MVDVIAIRIGIESLWPQLAVILSSVSLGVSAVALAVIVKFRKSAGDTVDINN